MYLRPGAALWSCVSRLNGRNKRRRAEYELLWLASGWPVGLACWPVGRLGLLLQASTAGKDSSDAQEARGARETHGGRIADAGKWASDILLSHCRSSRLFFSFSFLLPVCSRRWIPAAVGLILPRKRRAQRILSR